ncbi:hypothetical protein HID58_034008 [Brassica napus]|uniref:Uncharacterized protein n=1 Tax=Brassica napus TaxID=3708 RepID=A0ABQ8C1S8_BRANA|nr:hypothetical protein HID58_034008 [Brassica napus]
MSLIASISSPVSSLLLQNKSAELEVTTKNVLVKVLIADAVWSVYGESELPSYGVSTESMVFYLCVGYSTSDLMLWNVVKEAEGVYNQRLQNLAVTLDKADRRSESWTDISICFLGSRMLGSTVCTE